MYQKRWSYRTLVHIKEHLKNALTSKNNNMKVDIRMALILVKEAIKEEKSRKRNNDKKGGETK